MDPRSEDDGRGRDGVRQAHLAGVAVGAFTAIEAAAGTRDVSSVWERTHREAVAGATDDVRIVLDRPEL